MDVNFKYEVGQFVYFRQEVRRWNERGANGSKRAFADPPTPWQVVERHMQQCHGGVQLHYHFRTAQGMIIITEPELTGDIDDPSLAVAPPSPDTVP